MIRTKKERSKRQESRVAKEINGRVTIASGAIWIAKGDVRSSYYLVECKTTEKKVYPLSIKTWLKITEEATNDGFRIPVMCVDLEDGVHKKAVFKCSDFFEDKPRRVVRSSGLFYEEDDTIESEHYLTAKQVPITEKDKVFYVSGKIEHVPMSFELCVVDWDVFVRRVIEKEVS